MEPFLRSVAALNWRTIRSLSSFILSGMLVAVILAAPVLSTLPCS